MLELSDTVLLTLILGVFSLITLGVNQLIASHNRKANWAREDVIAARVAQVVDAAAETHKIVKAINRAVNGKAPAEQSISEEVHDLHVAMPTIDSAPMRKLMALIAEELVRQETRTLTKAQEIKDQSVSTKAVK